VQFLNLEKKKNSASSKVAHAQASNGKRNNSPVFRKS